MTEPRDMPRDKYGPLEKDEVVVDVRVRIRQDKPYVHEKDQTAVLAGMLARLEHAHAQADTLRGRLAALDGLVARRPALDGEASLYDKVSKAIRVAGECDAALRERNQWIDTCEQTGNKMHAEHHRAEAAEARLARLRERLEGWSQLAHAQPHTTLGECADSLRMTDAALAETVSVVPQEPDLGDVNAYPDPDTTRKSVPPASTPPEIPCMNEQWNGQDISDAMPCDCPQCRIEPPALPQEPTP